MKRFDLTFKGDILPDFDPDEVREGLAELFGINDELVLDELFSGDSFVLRSGLDRRSAADYFRKIAQLGGKAELVTRIVPDHQDSESDVVTKLESDQAHTDAQPETLHKDIDYYPSGEKSGSEPAAPDDSHREPTIDTGPSAAEVLQRLQGLQQEAEEDHNSKLRHLETLKAEVKQQTSAALEDIKQHREQVLLTAQDETTRLEKQEREIREQYERDIALLDEEEEAQASRLSRELQQLEAQYREQQEDLATSRTQLRQDRTQLCEAADARIRALEEEIAATRAQCEQDVAAIDKLLQEKDVSSDSLEQGYSEQTGSAQTLHQDTLEELEARKREATRQYEEQREAIRQRQQEQDRHREERLTGLWEDEEKNQHQAQDRLKQLEVTRKREEQALKQRLERLRAEEEKVRKGELSLP